MPLRSLLSACLLMCGLAAEAQDTPVGPFEHMVLPITDGLWLLQRPDPLRQPVEGNITVIAGNDGLLVVDTGGAPMAGRDAVMKIQGLSGQPVRWVVNTHWHGDHHLGNPAFRLAWPQAQFIAHANTQRDMTGQAMNYLDGQDVAIQGSIDQLGGLLESGLDAQGAALMPATRERYTRLQSDLRVMLRALDEVTLAGVDQVFTDSMTLDLGGRSVQLIHPGRGNTEGDVVVHVPDLRLLVSGDLVVAPTPYGFGSYPGDWLTALATLKALDWDMLIPGHGDPMRDRDYLNQLTDLIADFRAQATIAVAQGQNLEAFRASLDTAEWQTRFAAEDPLLQRLFQAWWVTPFSDSAWREASGLPIVQGEDGN